MAVAAESKEEREREERILKILNEFKLQGGQYHTDMIMAKTGDRLLGASQQEGGDAALQCQAPFLITMFQRFTPPEASLM